MQIQTQRPQITRTFKGQPPATETNPPKQPEDPKPPTGNIEGLIPRAIYGASFYGLPALAGAAMGSAGVLPAAAIGAGIAAITHPGSLKDAAVFGLMGACVGAGVGYAASLLSATPYSWVPVVAFTAVGAASQVVFARLES
ncbi:hypothetical protein ABS71_14630 [bacterium SCN 62-11]|nr:MAG: hypothetical protein ABS71_14630 [bacterium SCN 62-11]